MTNGQVRTDCKFADILNPTSVISCMHKFEPARMKHLLVFGLTCNQTACGMSNQQLWCHGIRISIWLTFTRKSITTVSR